jgi:branched-subunit amino acid transport protein
VDDRWITILGLVVIAYGTRAAGFWLSSRLPENATLEIALRNLPMVSLVALTAPSVIEAGWPGFVAAIITWLITWKTNNLLYAMIGGVIVFALVPG